MQKNKLENGSSGIVVLMVLAAAILVIVYGPFITIWALNTLFPVLAIPSNFYTWLATIVVVGVLRPGINYTHKN